MSRAGARIQYRGPALTLGAPRQDSAAVELTATLERVARLGDGYQLHIAPAGPGWLRADELMPGGTRFEALVERLGGAYDPVTRRAVGSQFVLEYLHFTWPAITAYAVERCVPDVSADNLLVRLDERGMPIAFGLAEPRFGVLEGDPLAGEAAFVARNDGELLAWLLGQAIDRNAGPLVEGIRARLSTSGTALWGNVAAAFVHPLLWHVQLVASDPAAIVRDAEALLRRPAERALGSQLRLLKVLNGDTEWTVTARRTCCLAWSMPDKARCAECPLVREPDAGEFLRAKLAEAIERGEAVRAEIGPPPGTQAEKRTA